ncbi:uncharacterized protein LOC118782065 [Megalops cyprinoides]|uniref:uncharacterized protein LOC118782065 n=1 Tax=Megalops cyprinoides TaxID=118141 RepID=UPI0018642008|nr:uncharacterized protein LOC118782065 [Megalops cyprinoides]
MGFKLTLTVLQLLLLNEWSSGQPECAMPPISSRIVGGQNAADGNWPWQASLHIFGTHVCGGSLINKEWVMSAAHCFFSTNSALWTIYLGRQDQQGSSPNEVSRSVAEIIRHPDYDSNTFDNDIALVKLASPVNFTDFIRPVCLAASNSSFYNGTESWITGWGNINEGEPLPLNETLQEAQVFVIGNSQCSCLYGFSMTDNMICAGLLDGGIGACQGDSGGPMVSLQNLVWVQSGIVSFGVGCAQPNFPAVYTRVSRYQSWISSQISTDQPGFVLFSSSGIDSDTNFTCNIVTPTIIVSPIPPPPRPFYPFGVLNGDTVMPSENDGSSFVIQTLTRFLFFGSTHRQLYVNENGFLTFDAPSNASDPVYFPSYPRGDIIAPFWTNIDSRVNGTISYRQVTSGSLLQQATQDINQYFPNLTFTASWVFIATWDRVAYFPLSGTETSFQVVLISDGILSFVLMNYGHIAPSNGYVQAGYDTVNSTHHFQIPGSFQSNITGLNSTSNVNETGRWAFRTDKCINSCTLNGTFYPFGVSSGDTVSPFEDDGSSSEITLNENFPFFQRKYRQLYVNNNGFLTFERPWSNYIPFLFPSNSGSDIIAVFWTDLDNRANGIVSYRQVTSGSLLQRATQDVNQYFPSLHFTASWVFIATWDRVAYFPVTGTETSFQVVLISDGHHSFTLMNYGRISPRLQRTEVGYDTTDSEHYETILGSYKITDLPFTSNVNVAGRWAFQTSNKCNEVKAIFRVRISALSTHLNPNDPSLAQAIRDGLLQKMSISNATCSA